MVLSMRPEVKIKFLERLEGADAAVGELLRYTGCIRVEDFHDLSYIRERIQLMRKEAEK